MLGAKLDYFLLRPLTHQRNYATEQELEARALREPALDPATANSRLEKMMARFEGHFPLRPELSYLDVGTGRGEIPIALGLAGCRNVWGIDLATKHITLAQQHATQLRVGEQVKFAAADIHQWQPPHRFDLVISNEALEHIPQPEDFLRRLHELVTPSGKALLAFGPLFHSPFGDHMNSFFRLPLPWRGVLFEEEALLRLRRERYRPSDRAQSLQEISGGLNMLRYSEFLAMAAASGWRIEFLSVNPQLKRIPLLQNLSNLLIEVPKVQDYFASSVYAVLRKQTNES